MKKFVVRIEPSWPDEGLFYASIDDGRVVLGREYTTPWSAKRGARRLLNALGATNWRFADESETDAVAEPAVQGVHPWARWEATDSDGSVYEFSDRPVLGSVVWWAPSRFDRCEPVRTDEPPENFAATLRRVNA